MLGFNLEAAAKAEVTKLVKQVETYPGVKQAEADIHNSITTITGLLNKITPAELSAALNLVFPGKYTAAEIAVFESDVEKAAAGLAALEAALQKEIS